MKIYVSGISRGIGHAIYNRLLNVYDVIGGSSSDGHNIESNYDGVIQYINDCDVFINNAYAPEYQTKMLIDMYDLWKYDNKHIINIGSCASDMKHDNPDRLKEYPRNKINQDDFIKDVNIDYCVNGYKDKVLCKVTNIKLGYVMTEFPSLYDKRYFPTMDVDYVSDVVEWIINQPTNINIRDISIHSTNTPIYNGVL